MFYTGAVSQVYKINTCRDVVHFLCRKNQILFYLMNLRHASEHIGSKLMDYLENLRQVGICTAFHWQLAGPAARIQPKVVPRLKK